MADDLDVEATDSERGYLDETVELRLRGSRRGLLCILGAIRTGASSLHRHPRPTATTMAVAAESTAERITDEFGDYDTLEDHVDGGTHVLTAEDVREDVQARLVEAADRDSQVADGGGDDVDACEDCGSDTDELRLSSDSHPVGPNRLVCSNCSVVDDDGRVATSSDPALEDAVYYRVEGVSPDDVGETFRSLADDIFNVLREEHGDAIEGVIPVFNEEFDPRLQPQDADEEGDADG